MSFLPKKNMSIALLILSLTLFSCNCFSELYITYPVLNTKKVGNKCYRIPVEDNLLSFIDAYFLTKKHDATLVCVPFNVDIYSKINNRIKLISFRDFFMLKRFLPVEKGRFHDYNFKKKDYLYRTFDHNPQKRNLNETEKKEIRSIFFFEEEKFLIKKDPNKKYIGLDLCSKHYLSNADKSKFAAQNAVFAEGFSDYNHLPLEYFVEGMKLLEEKFKKSIVFVLFTNTNRSDIIFTLSKHLSKATSEIVNIHSFKDIQSDFCKILGLLEMDGLILSGYSSFSELILKIGSFNYLFKPKLSSKTNDCIVMH